ncbi:MAG: N-acetylmuramoyl-L-alanine amidase [Bacteroidetes bacterium]|nr:N-acetylmuramoyl-L-alanine amidase [Bacteroidota bacterium]
MKKNIFILGLFAICFLVSSFYPKSKPIFSIKTVVIDAGHGGKDPGCHGSRYKEKDVALAVALKLGKYIEENMKDVKVVYTRKTDVFIELQERAEIANRAKADLFICIHCNYACFRDKKLKKDICKDEVLGAETYVMGIKNEQGKLDVAKRENSAILLEDNYVKKYDGFDPNSDESYIIMSMFSDNYIEQSLNFASKVQKQYLSKAGRVDKGVKRASLWVLWRTYMPSVLTEIGFLTNPKEEQFLGSVKGQDYVASGIFRAFREYKDEIEGTTKKYDDAIERMAAYKFSKEDSIEMEQNSKSKNFANSDSAEVELKDPPTEKKDEKKELVEEKKDQQSSNSQIVYKVQITSSDKPIPINSEKFIGVEKPAEYIDKGVYKYTSGECKNQNDATKLQAVLRKNGFKDAFVIAMQDGKRIPLK